MFEIPSSRIVEDVMEKNFITINKELTLDKALAEMVKVNQRTLIVANDNEELNGIISMTDISKWMNKRKECSLENITVEEIMITDFVYVNKRETLQKCRDIMRTKNIGLLPILEGKLIVGTLNPNHIRDHLYMNEEEYALTVRHILSEIKEGICAINKDGIVIFWNKFMEDRFSIKSSEIIGKHISTCLENTVSERVLKEKRQISEMYYSKERGKKYGLVDARPIFFNDKFMGVVCTEVDITEAKVLSKKLKKATETLDYLQGEVKRLSNNSFDSILGNSYKLEQSKEIAKRVAKTSSNILLFGESGTGKEVFSRAIHEYSERKGEFVPINCSAIPSELFESEFFGYESGSFTGANKKGKMGIFELAKNGTVFLDEIGELPLSMQAKLLRVLQEREVRRVGGEKIIKINCRIICATNKKLQELVEKDLFREDLYYRLNVVEINLPPLRERSGDLDILIHKFVQDVCNQNNRPLVTISNEAMAKLKAYTWRGNIRELKNTIEGIVVLSRGNVIGVDDIPQQILKTVDDIEERLEHEDEKLKDKESFDIVKETEKLEKKIIKRALEHCNGNKSKAAKMLKIPRPTLCYKINKYEVE